MEDNYWNCLKELDLFADVTPINIATEKEKFFTALNKGEVYNPKFTYKYIRTLSDVQKLEEAFQYTPHDTIISQKYRSHFDKEKQWITTFTQRNETDFPRLISLLYPLPSEKYELLAQQTLSESKINEGTENEDTISADSAKVIFEDTLKDAGYLGWQVLLKPIGAKAMVSSLKKELSIREGYRFKLSEIERLKVHEIHTHIRRYENGTKQPYALYKFGFPDYLETEEGLAIYNEEIHKVLTAIDLKKYALRVMACVWADNGSLFDVYSRLREYTTENDSWEIAMRVKRGLIDTSNKGGFYKDQLYFIGYHKVRKLAPEIREKLWIGKVGIADVK
jgi:hypothetical protein